MKKNSRLLLAVGLSLTMAFSTAATIASMNKSPVETQAYYSPSTHYEVSDTASELASYYSSISDSDTGTSLLSKLQSLNSSKRKKTMGYDTIGTDTSGAVIYTDYDLNSTAKDSNGQTYGTKVASFYTKTAATSWNREHMWPNSHGGNNVEADILHTRPTISSENSSRGNSFYVEGKNSSSAGWDPYTAGYDAEVRGECARVILYCVVAYPSFTLSDADSHSTSNSNKDNMMGNMNTLIKWHFDYPPNVYEMNRNNGAEYLQGNRNPFVDHPEYVAKIWSSFNSTVSSLCSSHSSDYTNWVPGNYCNYGSATPVNAVDSVSISASTASVTVGSTTTLSATSSDSGTITWTTSNSSVATISSSSTASGSSITVTGKAAGTATITAKRTINGTERSATCTVTVTKVVSSLSKGSTSPTKTTYTAGESFDPSGLTITATYSDSTTGNVTSSVVWTPDPLTAGTTSVTGTFGGKTITITGLTVNAATEPEIIDSNSDLSVGDYVVIRTAASVGVTGWNNNKDATVSETESEWKKFYVASASSSGFTLKDESADNYIASPGSSNQFVYGSAATCSTDSSGHLICNSRYLCQNGTNYRFYSSISSYLPFFIYKVPASSSTKTLSSISVSTAPTKTSYTAGEYFDPTGLVVTRTYSDSTSDTYTYSGHTSEFTFDPTTSTALTTSNTSVTISYGGKSCSQSISVSAAAKTLSSIAVSGQKTSYSVDDTFVKPTVTATFSDNTQQDVTSSATFSGYDMATAGNYTVTVSYTYGSTTKTTSYSITVSASSSGDTSTVTINFASGGNCTSTSGTFTGVSFTTAQSSAQNAPAYNTSSYELRLYYNSSGNGNTFTLTPSSGYTITGIVITASSTSYTPSVKYNVDGGSDTSGTWSSETMTISGISASSSLVFRNANTTNTQLRIKSVAVNLSSESGSTAPTLSSISLNTTNATTSFSVGDTFSYAGLVVTAHYSDDSSETVSSGYTVSTPDMSTAGNKTITVTYSTVSTTYTITVTASGGTATTSYELVTTGLSAGDQVVIVAHGSASQSATSGYAMKNAETSNGYYMDVVNATMSNQKITNYTSTMALWTVVKVGSKYSLYCESLSKYLSGNLSGTYKNLNLVDESTSSNGTQWTISSITNGYDMITEESSTSLHMEYYSSKFTTYTGVNASNPLNFYKKVVTNSTTYEATDFATDFMSLTESTCSSSSDKSSALSSIWTTLQASGQYYSLLSDGQKLVLKNADANNSGTTIEIAMARYDYIVNTYGLTNFIERDTSGSLVSNNFLHINGDTTIAIIVVISLTAVTAIGGYILIRRKKEN